MDDHTSFLTPLGISIIVLSGFLILFLPRRFVFLPVFIAIFYLTIGQKVNIVSLNFFAYRILILFGWIRVIVRKEIYPIGLNTIDKAFILWVVVSVILYNILWQTSQAFINHLGFTYDACGLYFLYRILLRDLDDISRSLKLLGIILIPFATLMLIEKFTGKNIFSTFGGVYEFSEIRIGKIRAQGSFRHPILAGTAGAALMPLFVGLWLRNKKNKLIATMGMISSTIITLSTSSSGPIVAYIVGMIGMACWRFRKHMRIIRWGILFGLVLVNFVMKAPIWYLPARMSELIGGSGWYRSYLIEMAMKHLNEWWMIGTKSTAHWMPWYLTATQADITNQFIGEGIRGGLLRMFLFIAIMVFCFKSLGNILRLMQGKTFSTGILIWSMGASLLANIMSFLSVAYFDQIIMLWYLLLAMIATSSSALILKMSPEIQS